MLTGMNLLLWTGQVTASISRCSPSSRQPASTASSCRCSSGDAAHYKTVRKELDAHGLGCTAVTVGQRRY